MIESCERWYSRYGSIRNCADLHRCGGGVGSVGGRAAREQPGVERDRRAHRVSDNSSNCGLRVGLRRNTVDR